MQDQNWLNSIRPLPARVIPYPWEDLASLLSRSAEVMGYEKLLWLLNPEDIPHFITSKVCNLRDVVSYQVLERLLLVNEERLYHMTYHRFAEQLQSPEEILLPASVEEIQRPMLTKNILQRFISTPRNRVCPLCLEEKEGYGHLYWNVLPIIACPRHNVLLVDQCPVCHESIPVLRPLLTTCPRCRKGDYRHAAIVTLIDDPLFRVNQDLILNQLNIEDVRTSGIKMISGTPLWNLTSWQYFRLLDAFRVILCPLFPSNPFLQKSSSMYLTLDKQIHYRASLSVDEWFVLIATFHYIFESWPDNFFKFLDVIPLVRENMPLSGKQSHLGLIGHFGSMYRRWLYKRLAHSSYSFLREAFEDYLKKRYTRGMVSERFLPFQNTNGEAQDRRYLTMDQTMKMLGPYGNKMCNARSLIRRGIIRTQKVELGMDGKKCVYLVEKADVEALLQEWSNLLPIEILHKSLLGVNKECVLALTEGGFLTLVHGPSIDQYKTWLYQRTEVEQFIAALLKFAVKGSQRSDDVPLSKAYKLVQLPLKDILAEVLSGFLKPVDTETSQPLFQRLVIPRKEVNCFLNERMRRRQEDMKLFTLHEVAALFGVGINTIRLWIGRGFILAERLAVRESQSRLYICQEAIQTFRQTYVFYEEAQELLGVSRSSIAMHVSQGSLHPLGSGGGKRSLFLREEIETQEPSISLTAQKAAE